MEFLWGRCRQQGPGSRVQLATQEILMFLSFCANDRDLRLPLKVQLGESGLIRVLSTELCFPLELSHGDQTSWVMFRWGIGLFMRISRALGLLSHVVRLYCVLRSVTGQLWTYRCPDRELGRPFSLQQDPKGFHSRFNW